MKSGARRQIVQVRAHAKVNLHLRILGRRPDGYHDIRTVLQTLALHDTLRFEPFDGPFEVRCAHVGVPRGRDNLVWLAAEAVWRALGRSRDPDGVRVTLEKRIPLQSGLGGGSADAAATLIGLLTLWRASLSRSTVTDLAAALGADVPFFLWGGTALGLDRGDTIYPLADAQPCWVTILVPALGVSTKEAYRWYDEALVTPGPLEPSAPLRLDNDFEAVVAARHPVIADLKRSLLEAGAGAAGLSGSGSAVVGLFESEPRARRAARAAPAETLAARIVTRTIGRRSYRRTSGLAVLEQRWRRAARGRVVAASADARIH